MACVVAVVPGLIHTLFATWVATQPALPQLSFTLVPAGQFGMVKQVFMSCPPQWVYIGLMQHIVGAGGGVDGYPTMRALTCSSLRLSQPVTGLFAKAAVATTTLAQIDK